MAYMIGVLAHLAHLEAEAEEERAVSYWRIERRRLRDNCDPFNSPRWLFVQNFRVSKEIARGLIDRLGPYFPARRAGSLTPTHRVLTALKFFANGSFQRGCVAEHNTVNMCQTSVSVSLRRVMNAMLTELGEEVIRFPRTAEERATVKQGFYQKFGIPGVVGAIDCTLISMYPPKENEEQYFCRKKCHCINCQLISDSNLRILNVNARHGGASNDAFIWGNSGVFHFMRNLVLNDREPYTWLIGDSGYPLQPWLLTPIVDAPENTPAGRYTTAHIHARNCVERLNGIFKAKWQCTKKFRALWYEPAVVKRIIKCCAILHNIALQAMPDYLEDEEAALPPLPELGEDLENNFHDAGLQVRANLIAAHFQ